STARWTTPCSPRLAPPSAPDWCAPSTLTERPACSCRSVFALVIDVALGRADRCDDLAVTGGGQQDFLSDWRRAVRGAAAARIARGGQWLPLRRSREFCCCSGWRATSPRRVATMIPWACSG